MSGAGVPYDVLITRSEFKGKVVLYGTDFHRGLALKQCIFNSDLDLKNSRIALHASLDESTFNGPLTLKGAQCDHDLTL